MHKFKPFRLSPITRKLIAYLEDQAEGELILYEDLGEQIDMDCRPGEEGYPYVLSALKIIERSGHNYANIRSEGYRKLNPNETVNDVEHRQLNAKKRIDRGIIKLSAVDFKRLGDIERNEFHSTMIAGRMVQRLLSMKAKTKLLGMVKKHPDPTLINYEDLSEIYLRPKHNGA